MSERGEFSSRKSYNERYAGEGATYSQTYYDTPIPRNVDTIVIAALKVADKMVKQEWEGEKTLRILDFGCGDGRYRTAAYKVAEIVKEGGINVELVAYDVSDGGLDAFKGKLKKEGFDDEHKRDNLVVNFVIGDTAPGSIEKNKREIGSVDVSYAIFGVISHIPGRENRVQTLKMLNEVTQSEVIVTAPGWRRFREELAYHNKLREAENPYKLATEPGDLYYTSRAGTEDFYHVYWYMSEFVGELNDAGLKGEVCIAKIGDEKLLAYRPNTLGLLDGVVSQLASKYLPNRAIEYVADYFLALTHDKDRKILPVQPGGMAAQYADSTYSVSPTRKR